MKLRNPNFFEKVLLVIGIIMIIVGYFLLHRIVNTEGLGSNAIMAVFLWLILIILIILTAVNENMKEELAMIIRGQSEEITLLRQELTKKKK